MGVLSQIRWILHKDLLIEWRARSRVLALACFAATILLLFSFAIGPDTKALRLHAAGYLWLTILLSSTLLLNRSFRTETESGYDKYCDTQFPNFSGVHDFSSR